MKIESFRFHDRATGWQLEEARFEAFNLLVGVSGVGKSRILRSLEEVQRIGAGRPSVAGDAEWLINFEHESHHYSWEASVASAIGTDGDDDTSDKLPGFEVIRETITKDHQELLVERNGDSFRFEGRDLPKLKRSDCAIALLSEEPSIAPLKEAFRSFISSARAGENAGVSLFPRQMVESALTLNGDSGRLGLPRELPTLVKAYVVQEIAQPKWTTIKDLFISIFPSVEDVRVSRLSGSIDPQSDANPIIRRLLGGGKYDSLGFILREHGVEKWIRSDAISSGMGRALNLLVDISLAPPATVVLIDEFENSLGKNCMPSLTSFIFSRAPDLQFLITSHHPYIINNIPISAWKFVQRRGSRVQVLPASDIPALQKASHHDAFDRLLNLPEFEEGIA